MTKILLIIKFISLYHILVSLAAKECFPRDYGNGGTVCVCNSSYCDTIDPVQPLEKGKFVIYSSNQAGLRFKESIGYFRNAKTTKNHKRPPYRLDNLKSRIFIDANIQYQQIFGWGGSFTDSSGINIQALNDKAKNNLMMSYFSNKGIEFNLCRVPIGGTDFSTKGYTYDDDYKDDYNLNHFNLTEDDYKYKIPLMKKAINIRNASIHYIASAWSPPLWMKTKKLYGGNGILLPKYRQTWADYHIKFLEAYEKEGLQFWAITTQNEPALGLFPDQKINCLAWSLSSLGRWIAENFGPAIRNSKYKYLKIITLDDMRPLIPIWTINLFHSHNKTRDYIDGIGLHGYFNQYSSTYSLTATHNLYPDLFLISTETTIGPNQDQLSANNTPVILGSWIRAEIIMKMIIEDVNNWVTGWIEWNLAVNEDGGPSYIGNAVDATIIVNATSQEFYKQPMFYAMGHFSKFVPENSLCIKFNVSNENLLVSSFLRPDNGTVVVLFNPNNVTVKTMINDVKRGTIHVDLSRHSFNTILYW